MTRWTENASWAGFGGGGLNVVGQRQLLAGAGLDLLRDDGGETLLRGLDGALVDVRADPATAELLRKVKPPLCITSKSANVVVAAPRRTLADDW